MEKDVEKLVLADISQEQLDIATEQLKMLGDKVVTPDITTAVVDASDTDAVAEVIRGCDIVFEGIYPIFNIPVMKACIKEKCHYLDLFASPTEGPGLDRSETIGAQLELFDEFKAAGITALPSIGMSPGWTSLAAQHVIDNLDTVNDVIIRWADWMDTDEFIAPISAHVLWHEWFGAPHPTRTVNGKAEGVDLVASQEEFDFPEPIGKKRIYTVTAHPDVVLIPKFAGKPMNICEEKGGWYLGSRTMEDIWVTAIQQCTVAQGDETSEVNYMEEFSKPFLLPTEYNRLLKEGKIRDHVVCFSTEVNGYKDGGYIRHIQYYTSTLKIAQSHLPWASPAVYGTVGGMPIELVLGLGRGEITQRGVFSIGELGISDQLNRNMAKRGQILTEVIERPSGIE